MQVKKGGSDLPSWTKGTENPGVCFGMPEAKKDDLLVLEAQQLVFPGERTVTAVGIPSTLLHHLVCYFWFLFSEYYFCYLLFQPLLPESCAHTLYYTFQRVNRNFK